MLSQPISSKVWMIGQHTHALLAKDGAFETGVLAASSVK